MWRNRMIALTLGLGVLLCTPRPTQAQVFGGGLISPWGWGGWGGPWGGWGGWGGWNRPYTFGGMGPGWGYNPWGMGGNPGFGGMGNPYFGGGGMWMDSFSYSVPQVYPGWAVSDAPRKRDSLYPALQIIPASAAVDNRANIRVVLPSAEAQVWLDGALMTQTGRERLFVTPVLDSKSTYSYRVRARWRGQNGMQEETRTIDFRAGASVVVDFTRPR